MACTPEDCTNLNVKLRSCWPGYAVLLQRAAVPRTGRLPASVSLERAIERGSWKPINLTCIPSDTVELGHCVHGPVQSAGKGDGAAVKWSPAGRPAGVQGRWHWAHRSGCFQTAFVRFPTKVVQESNLTMNGKKVFLWSWFNLTLCF